MMKNGVIVVGIVLLLVACAPKPEPGTTAQATGEGEEMIHTEDFEKDEGPPEVPPEGSLPLSEIVASVEVASHHTIIEAEFEDGVWKIEFVMEGEEYELQIDPMTGETLGEGPVRTDDD